MTDREGVVCGANEPHAKQVFALVDALPVPAVVFSAGEDGEPAAEFVNRRFTETYGYLREDIPTAESWWRRAARGESSSLMTSQSFGRRERRCAGAPRGRSGRFHSETLPTGSLLPDHR